MEESSIKSANSKSSNKPSANRSSATSQKGDGLQYAGTGTAITLGLTQTCASNDYVVRLEKDFNLLQEAFLELCTQLIRIQIRVRQITSARPTELRSLLEDLEKAAFQSAKEMNGDDELPNLMSDAVTLGSIQEKQHRFIEELHNKFSIDEYNCLQMEKYNPNDPRGSKESKHSNNDDGGTSEKSGSNGSMEKKRSRSRN
ncbi:uncharacterized protein LOC119672549 [Teleopsis dalmanni]|uniref:uncharacterized protein LOC119672549 n=1 Tax=Teleopsis dalmanni TaxID=139649 RepID=UPI0018CE6139|nr:uncharacterized protein LOC119672549 [Teleopsis dalmanni]